MRRERRAAARYVVDELVRTVAVGTGVTVRAAHLDFTPPTPSAALRELAADGFASVRVVPLLFAPGYHLTHDVPRAVEASGVDERMDVSVAPALLAGGPGQRQLMLRALAERLLQAGADGSIDGLVLASAGSSSRIARQHIARLARALERSHGIPVETAFASAGSTPSLTQACEALSDRGLRARRWPRSSWHPAGSPTWSAPHARTYPWRSRWDRARPSSSCSSPGRGCRSPQTWASPAPRRQHP